MSQKVTQGRTNVMDRQISALSRQILCCGSDWETEELRDILYELILQRIEQHPQAGTAILYQADVRLARQIRTTRDRQAQLRLERGHEHLAERALQGAPLSPAISLMLELHAWLNRPFSMFSITYHGTVIRHAVPYPIRRPRRQSA